jgi:hypothetical protein
MLLLNGCVLVVSSSGTWVGLRALLIALYGVLLLLLLSGTP